MGLMRAGSFHARQAERTAKLAASGQERRETAQIHADKIIARYVDAVRNNRGDEVADKIEATYNGQTGYYHVCVMGGAKRNMREQVLTDAAAYHYACAHERELTANIPEDDK